MAESSGGGPFVRFSSWHHLSIATGCALIITGICGSRHWPYQGRGLIAALHIGLVCMAHVWPGSAPNMLATALVFGVIGSHLPGYMYKLMKVSDKNLLIVVISRCIRRVSSVCSYSSSSLSASFRMIADASAWVHMVGNKFNEQAALLKYLRTAIGKSDIPSKWLELFMIVAANKEKGIRTVEAQNEIELSQGNTSRLLKIMSLWLNPKTRQMEGHDVVMCLPDHEYRHQKRVFLSSKGKIIADEIDLLIQKK